VSLECMGLFRMYGGLYRLWGSLVCMGHIRLYWGL
jgi:hypothetical protein